MGLVIYSPINRNFIIFVIHSKGLWPMFKIILFLFMSIFVFGADTDSKIQYLPDIVLKDLNKKKVSTSELYKDGPVLINFWYLACAPCIKEMKFLDEFNKKYADSGFSVVSVNTDTPRSLARVKSLVKSKKYSMDILSDPSSKLLRKLGSRACPFTVLINMDGTIYSSHLGYSPGDEIALEEEIKDLINKNSTSLDSDSITIPILDKKLDSIIEE